MYALLSYTPGTAVAVAVSENKQTLIEKLRERAKEFFTPRYDNDNELLDCILEDINQAEMYWCDDDEEYPFTLAIQQVDVI